jgi:hypothetical protein
MAVVDIWRNSVTGHQSEVFEWWNMLPDDERQQWTLEPFTSVGPLAFGMSPGEVSEALSGVTEETQRYLRSADRLDAIKWTIEEGEYRKFGLRIFYRQERLAGVAVDALCGPQVLVEDVALVGQVPSVLEQWMLDRHRLPGTSDEFTEFVFMTAGVPGSEWLGVVIDVQRAGDHLITRPLFFPREAIDAGFSHWLPDNVWSRC